MEKIKLYIFFELIKEVPWNIFVLKLCFMKVKKKKKTLVLCYQQFFFFFIISNDILLSIPILSKEIKYYLRQNSFAACTSYKIMCNFRYTPIIRYIISRKLSVVEIPFGRISVASSRLCSSLLTYRPCKN